LDKRLDSMNQFREALRDQAGSYVTRTEYHVAHDAVVHIIDTMRIELSRYAVRVDEFDRAGSIERAQLDKRLDSMNEFRLQLKDQASSFVPRGEYVAAHDAVMRVADQARLDMSRYAVRVDEFDRSDTFGRAQLDKQLDGMNEIRVHLKEQTALFATRGEVAVQNDAVVADIRRLETTTAAMMRKDAYDKIEGRTVVIENKLANWEGRLWALGAVFLLINVFVSWYLSGRLGH
jgi:hypothetical protein